jgi:hypothetical protein
MNFYQSASPMHSLEELFCSVDDFCQNHEAQKLLSDGGNHRNRSRRLCLSEIMTIIIAFHQSHYRNFKAYYLENVCVHWRGYFPNLVTYQRFIDWIPSTLLLLCGYLKSCFGKCSGISFIDSTSIKVCHNRRIAQNRVFKDVAARGKTSVDWFFGFKLHLAINHCGELLNIMVTPGNVDDRKPVPQLLSSVVGKVFGDKGYISAPLAKSLLTRKVQLITRSKRNMKNRLMLLKDMLLLRKRAIVESVIDQLKNIPQIEHSRHRSHANFVVNMIAGLIAYCHQPQKPSLDIDAILA